MAHFKTVPKDYPEFWVMRRGKVTAKDAMRHYQMKTEEDAARMLDSLVRDRRLVKFTEDGVTWWSRT
jgi:hypothetical protein